MDGLQMSGHGQGWRGCTQHAVVEARDAILLENKRPGPSHFIGCCANGRFMKTH